MLNADNDSMHVDVLVIIVSCWHLFFLAQRTLKCMLRIFFMVQKAHWLRIEIDVREKLWNQFHALYCVSSLLKNLLVF